MISEYYKFIFDLYASLSSFIKNRISCQSSLGSYSFSVLKLKSLSDTHLFFKTFKNILLLTKYFLFIFVLGI